MNTKFFLISKKYTTDIYKMLQESYREGTMNTCFCVG